MPYQSAIDALLRDVNLYEYGVILNHPDHADLNTLIGQLCKALESGTLSAQDQKILPVFLICQIKASLDALQNLDNLSPAMKQSALLALQFVKDQPASFQQYLKDVETLRQEP